MKNFKLPEKWAIKTDNPEFYDFFNQTIKPKTWHDYTKEYATEGFDCYMHSKQYEDGCLSSSKLESGYTEITFEQLTQSEEWKEWKVELKIEAFKTELKALMAKYNFGKHESRRYNTREECCGTDYYFTVDGKTWHGESIAEILDDIVGYH